LGNGTYTNTNTPQRIGSETNWQAVEAGWRHTVALRADGTLWAWGQNYRGQLGNGTYTETNTPQRIGSDTNWQAVAAGQYHTVALRTDRTLWAWGNNSWGQLGNGTYTSTNTPQQIGTETNWQAIDADNQHTLALREDGTLWAWGVNRNGQLGIGTFDTNAPSGRNTPQQVGTNADWQAVAAGAEYSMALRTDGTLWAWGYFVDSASPSTFNPFSYGNTPQRIGTNANWQALSTKWNAVALRKDGTLWTWGGNARGQLGNGTNGTNTGTTTPQQVGTNTNWGPPP
jgi:alpha-tubulin suppressor-like RCC1 family protein